jgi:outer membrane protein OmpA-like peptidoglycan-associated protein
MKHSYLPLALAFTSLFAAPAFANNSIDVQTFNPSTSDHFVFLEDGYKSEWPKVSKYYFGANYNYVSDPLVVLDPTQTTKEYSIIDSIQTLDLFFGVKVSNNFGLFFALPIDYVSYSADSPAPFKKGTVTALGDAKIEGKIRITDDDNPTSIAIIPEFHLPTGSTQDFVSDASTYVGIRAAIERQFDTFTLVGNLGFAVASNAIYTDQTFVNGIDYRKRLIVGIGGFLPFNDTWGANLEFNSISMIPFDKTLNPNDAYLGVRYAALDGLAFTAGASLGKIGGPSGDDYRIVAGIRYTLFEEKKQLPKPVYISPSQTIAAPNANGVIDSTPHAILLTNKIELRSSIYFVYNAAALQPTADPVLDDVATLMKRNPNSFRKVYVDGHTVVVGSDQYNLNLSLARARAVKAYLVSRGVPATKIEPRGFGNRKPKVAKDAPLALVTNERIEFNFLK